MVGSSYISGWEYKSNHCLCIYMEKNVACTCISHVGMIIVLTQNHIKSTRACGSQKDWIYYETTNNGSDWFCWGSNGKKTLNDHTARTQFGRACVRLSYYQQVS
jgi:hypothetical protein